MITTPVNNEESLENEVLCPPDPERIVNGLRDTGYNFNTAMADIIDNSIAAKANQVDIKIDMNPLGEITIYVADNGIGMDKDDAVLAFSRHATSKLKTLDDLFDPEEFISSILSPCIHRFWCRF